MSIADLSLLSPQIASINLAKLCRWLVGLRESHSIKFRSANLRLSRTDPIDLPIIIRIAACAWTFAALAAFLAGDELSRFSAVIDPSLKEFQLLLSTRSDPSVQ